MPVQTPAGGPDDAEDVDGVVVVLELAAVDEVEVREAPVEVVLEEPQAARSSKAHRTATRDMLGA